MRNSVYFVSDLHLGSRSTPGAREAEAKILHFLDSIADDAKAIYLLGDVIDYWFEYRYVVPRGHVRFFGKIAELSDSGIEIIWITGNHDIWISDYIPDELGVRVVHDPYMITQIDGRKFFLAHGDRQGRRPLSFRIIQKLFRSKICRRMFAAIHPGLTVPLAYAWSSKSRKSDPGLASSPERSEVAMRNLCDFAEDYNALLDSASRIDYFIFGHLHIVDRKKLTDGAEVVELGDWISHFSYARFCDDKLELHSIKER